MRAGFHRKYFLLSTNTWYSMSQSLVNEGRFPLTSLEGQWWAVKQSQSLVNEGRFPHHGVHDSVVWVQWRKCRNPSLMRAGFH